MGRVYIKGMLGSHATDGKGDMAIVSVRKDVMLLRERGHGYSECT